MSQEVKLVNLAEFTKRHYGFQETEKSTKNSPCLKNPAGDVIVVKYQQNGVNTFFCPKDNQKGDIYNFVMCICGVRGCRTFLKVCALARTCTGCGCHQASIF